MSRAILFETPRMYLRRWSEADTDQYVRLLARPEVTQYMLAMPRVRVETFSAAFLEQWDRLGFGPFAAIDRATGTWIGQIGLSVLADWPMADNVEVGFELHPEFWGRGLAVEGAKASLDFGFDVVELGRIISTTNPANLRSRRVMEKVGLHLQGLQEYHGHETVWYSIDREDWGRFQPSPRA